MSIRFLCFILFGDLTRIVPSSEGNHFRDRLPLPF